MRVHVVIPTKRPPEIFFLCLSKIGMQESSHDVFITIVDSGSTASTIQRIREVEIRWPINLVQIPPANFSHSKTRNTAALSFDSDYTCFLTQDAMPVDNLWLENLVSPFEDPETVGVFGKHKAWPEHPIQIAEDLERHFQHFVTGSQNSFGYQLLSTDEVFFSNNNSAVRMSFFRSHQFPDVSFGEDQAWCQLVQKNGKRIVYRPESVVFHSHFYSVKDRFRRSLDEGVHLWNNHGIRPVRRPFLAILRAVIFGSSDSFSKAYSVASLLGYSLGSRLVGKLLINSSVFSYDRRLRKGKREG